MQTKLARGKAAFRTRSVGLSVAILAAAPLIAALALCTPDPAFAACGGTAAHAAGIHAAGSGGGGVHVASATAATSSAGSGGTLGCAGGSSASALRGLPTTSSGRVVETGAHASRTASSVRTATTRTANAGAHVHAVRLSHHG